MTYIPIVLITLWSIWLAFLVGRWMEDIRVVHNNLTLGAGNTNYMKPSWICTLRFRFSNIDPESLNETGRRRLRAAIWNERFMYASMVASLFLIAYLF